MANKKSTYTNKTALETVISILEGAEVEFNQQELIEKLNRMLATTSKPRKKSSAPSKTQIQNQAMLEELVSVMPDSESFGTDWVMEHVRYVTSPQKATTIIQLGIKQGFIAKTEPHKGKTRYVRVSE